MSLVYRIEAAPRDVWHRIEKARRYALIVSRIEGRGLFDFSSVHFSTAGSRATLRRRVGRLFPSAVQS